MTHSPHKSDDEIAIAALRGARIETLLDDESVSSAGVGSTTPGAADSSTSASGEARSLFTPTFGSGFFAATTWTNSLSRGSTNIDSAPGAAGRVASTSTPAESGAVSESVAHGAPASSSLSAPSASSRDTTPGATETESLAAPDAETSIGAVSAETGPGPAPAPPDAVDSAATALAGQAPSKDTPYFVWGQDTVPFDATPSEVRQAVGATNLTVDGTGIKVGVISNSFNNKGGAASDEANGLLPSASKVKILQDLPFTAGSPNDDEGRAMMQVVHDIAPGSSLDFCTLLGTSADFTNGIAGSDTAFADAILALAADGCKVICDDIGFTGVPWFQDGVIGAAIKTVEQEGVTYLIAAGNERSGVSAASTAVSDPAYQSAWKSTGINLFFNGNLNYTHFDDALDFGGGNPFQTVTLAAGAHTEFELQWNQPWGAATSDLAFVITIGSGIVLNNGPQHYAFFTREESTTPNGQSTVLADDPYVQESADPDFPELINNTTAPIQFQVSIVNLSGPDPGFIKYISNGNGNPTNAVVISGENAGTSVGHQESPYAITVGAADVGNTPAFGNNPALSEYFSSSGRGDQWFFDANGNPLPAAQLLNVVDVTGVDDIGTSASSLGDFFGTSCATPSIAAVAALMLEANSSINPSDVQNLLEDSAIPMINPAVSGAGLVQANAAVSFAKTLTITGNAGGNVLLGTHLGDTIFGKAGNDILIGGAGTNFLDGGAGADELDGTGGTSFAYYGDSTTGLTINLTNPSLNTGDAVGDSYVDVHDVLGSNFADTIVGDNAGDILKGGAGADAITGKAGNDMLFGGVGADSLAGGGGTNYLDGGAGADKLDGTFGTSYASYADATAAVKVDLLNPALNTGDAAGDSYVNIHDVLGSNFADTIIGDNAGDILKGGAGADTITGGTGIDTLYGGAGDDTLAGGAGTNFLDGGAGADKLNGTGGTSFAYYGDATKLVKVDLLNPALNSGDALGDTYVNIHDVLGSNLADTIIGDNAGDVLQGGAGPDTIAGGTGADAILGGPGADVLTGGAGADQFRYAAASDGGDTIKDFSHAAGDTIWISHTGFGGGLPASGALTAAHFGITTNATTASGVGEFLWHAATSVLAWDADGTGAGAAVKIATLTGVTTLTAADIHLF